MTVEYRTPVRMNVPQDIRYIFRDPDQVIIDLSAYTSVVLETKLQGAVYSTVTAAFDGAKTTGAVRVASLSFTTAGVWDLQFVADDGTNKLFGEPVQIKVVRNVENLDLNQLPQY